MNVFQVFFPLLFSLSHASSDFNDVTYSGNLLATYFYKNLPQPEENNVFSPLGLHLVLALLYEGAGGDTQDALKHALHLSSQETTFKQYQSLLKLLNSQRNVTIKIANQLYIRKGYRLKNRFRKKVAKRFNAKIVSIDLDRSSKTPKEIRRTIRRKTDKKLQKLVSSDDFNDFNGSLVLNVVRFRGEWAVGFEKNRTRTEKFYVHENEIVDCALMYREGYFEYADNSELDSKVLVAKFRNERFQMVIILPNSKAGINDLPAKLDRVDIKSVVRNVTRRKGEVYLPRFKIKTSHDLQEPLFKLGFTAIFEIDANFSKMIDQDQKFMVNQIKQKAILKIDEDGGEEEPEVRIPDSADIPPPFYFRADYSFIFLLMVNLQDEDFTIPLMGEMRNPGIAELAK